MASILFQRTNLNLAADVFSYQGYTEETVSELELALKSFDLSSEETQKQNLTMGEIYYKVAFHPNQEEKSVKSENISLYGKSSGKIVPLVFGIHSPFFLITAKDKIPKELGQSLLSNLSFAISSLRIHFPYFVQIGEKSDCTFLGATTGKDHQILYKSYISPKNFDASNYPNVKNFITSELKGQQLEEEEVSAKILYNTGSSEKSITALFDFPQQSAENVKIFLPQNASKSVALMSIKPKERNDSILRKAIHYSSSQNTAWPASPTKSNLAKQLLQKCTEIECERPLKGALPGGILEKLALAMCDESFTMLWRSFISLMKEYALNKIPFAPVKLHYNDSLLQQKINVLNLALESMSNGRLCFACPICDDDMISVDAEIRKLEAAIPTVSIERFEQIKEAILSFRAKNDYPSFDNFNASLQHKSSENSAIQGVWDAIPFYVGDTKEAITHILDWFDRAKPAEIHAQMIIILVAVEIRNLGGDNINGAYTQQILAKTLAKATILPELSQLLQPLDFLKAADDVASTIIEGMIGVEMLNTVAKMFPSMPVFVDALVRNGFAVAENEEEKKKLLSIFKPKGLFSASNYEQTSRVTVTGVCGNESYRFFFASSEKKPTIIGVAKVQQY